jgi:acyl-coenzyme A synthetase/AMP-(fatty) acid ligase
VFDWELLLVGPFNQPLPRNANGKVMKRQLREAWAVAQ